MERCLNCGNEIDNSLDGPGACIECGDSALEARGAIQMICAKCGTDLPGNSECCAECGEVA